MFVCKVCGNEVKHGQAFCPTCGADVVDNYQTICPVCHAKNSAGSRYCAKCGGILQVMRKPVCAVCGVKNLPGAKFCVSCGAPIVVESETHSDKDMLEARKTKLKLDTMERDRMAAVDKEIAEKRARIEDEREQAITEIEDYRRVSEEEYRTKSENLEKYRQKLNELGSEDVELLKKMSAALKTYSKYYADPYTQIDEDEIEGDTYVCPACGTINPLTATHCTHCGRNKARALLLLAKNKIKQSPPIKRKQTVIPAPEADLEVKKTPTLDEFIDSLNTPVQEEKVQEEPVQNQNKEPVQDDFSGPNRNAYPPYGYPYSYPQYPYPYPAQPAYQAPVQPMQNAPQQNACAQCQQPCQPQYAQRPQGAPAYLVGEDGKPYQMPPIVQPVAFVPYVTQEQPLMQYAPQEQRPIKAQPIPQPQQNVNKKRGKKR